VREPSSRALVVVVVVLSFQTLGKSVKMLPVMLIGMLFYGKKYPLRSYICMSLLALGVAGFFLLKPAKAVRVAPTVAEQHLLSTEEESARLFIAQLTPIFDRERLRPTTPIS